MAISLRPAQVRRYKEIVRLLFRYGRGALARGLDAAREVLGDEAPEPAPGEPSPEELARDLERLGPTFIKLGQLLSTRADLLPPAWLEALSRLQDDVAPVPHEEVERVVVSELGVRMSKAFSFFASEPVAAASLGQVHAARLRDGRPVAVKVQRPGIRERVAADLEAISGVARLLVPHVPATGRFPLEETLAEVRRTIAAELDYRREARNLELIGASLAGLDAIVVPRPIGSFVTGRVLTMEWVDGRKVTEVEPLLRLDVDGSRLAEQLFRAYLRQILVDGLFHADPHPGNVLLTPDGRVALVDLGMVARVSSDVQAELLHLLLAIVEGRADEAADRAAGMGTRGPEFAPDAFRHRVEAIVGALQDATVKEMQIGRLVLEVTRAAGASGVTMPVAFALLGKTLMNLDEVGRALDPSFDPNASVRRNAAELLRERMKRSASAGNVVTTILEAKELVEKLPARASRLLDLLARNELKLTIDAIDESVFLEGLQKVANRITLGLVVAALIVGAAMLMRVPTSFRILGYPGLAILCFLLAAGGGVALAASIVATDRRSRG